ncbi:VOC family protein [Megalodesulfovibrio paquesii]
MQPRISMITLGVTDLERATRFYEEGLGLPRLPFAGAISFFSLNGTWLALFDRDELAADAGVPPPAPLVPGRCSGVTLSHNVASKEEADAVLAQAVAVGAMLIKPAQDTDWGGYSGYFADPDGHLWEVAWNPHFWVGPADEERQTAAS